MLAYWSGKLWGLVLPMLLGTCVYLGWKTKQFALKNQLRAIRWTLQPDKGSPSGVSPFACLCTALAATVGCGNIVGVAFALTAGGPGALVWMWISSAVGTAIKYAECAQAVQYRRRDREGQWLGGTMVTLTHLPWKKLGLALGLLYAAVEVCATLTAANLVQSSAIADALGQMVTLPPVLTGVLIGGFTLVILSGGVEGVTKFSTFMVPTMLGLYMLGGLVVLVTHAQNIPGAMAELFRCAFDIRSVGAGAFGEMVRIGVSRGCFTNDSGTGTAGFSAAVTTADPVRQGLISSTSNLWDTGVICSVTALAILVSDVMDSGLNGVALTMAAYRTGLGELGSYIVGICLILFAFSSLPGLAFQGERALAFLTPSKWSARLYRLGFAAIAAVGCMMNTELALLGADLFNAVLILLNLAAVLLLPCPVDPKRKTKGGV